MDTDTVLRELAAREPIFHRPRFARTAEDFANLMSAGYWEVGASGTRYDRAFILKHLASHPPADADVAGWRCDDFSLRPLGQDTYLLTYSLDQNGRKTRRSTLWRRTSSGWQILYHQGTLIAAASSA